MDDRSRVVYYGSDETDDSGEFDLTVNKYINGKELNKKACSVRLVSSPDPVCNIPTDFAGGRSGVKLSRPSMVYRDIKKYTMGPFYYTTPMCDEPDTNENDDQEDKHWLCSTYCDQRIPFPFCSTFCYFIWICGKGLNAKSC